MSVYDKWKERVEAVRRSTPRFDIIDSHVHYLDFTQSTDGFPALTEAMDKAGVSRAVIFGMPMMKQWDPAYAKAPTYYLSNDSRCYYYSATDHLLANHLLAQPEEIRQRFFPFCCGFNCADRFVPEQIARLLDLYPGFWKGIGEIMSHHDDLTALTYGEGVRLNSPVFKDIFDLAAERGLPVLCHHNISVRGEEGPVYLDELEEALAHNRNCRIIWAHIGISRNIEIRHLFSTADRLLEENPNLWVDISWLVYDYYILGTRDNTFSRDTTLEVWASLIESHPDRFFIGSDKVGRWDTYPEEIFKYYPLLDKLLPETREKICRGNLLAVLEGRT